MVGGLSWATREQLSQRTSAKWRKYPAPVIPLWVAEMDVALAPEIVEALEAALRRGDTGYPWGEDYVEAFAGFAARRWCLDGVAPERALVTGDVLSALRAALSLTGVAGDAVVICPPVYPPFYSTIREVGRRVVEAPLDEEGRLDLDNLETALEVASRSSRRAALLLANPHNPTGSVASRAELVAVTQRARAHGVRVVVDEIHAPLVLPGTSFTPYLALEDTEEAFVATSASKGWNLAGFKAGLLLAGARAATELSTLPESTAHGAGHVGTLAHQAAFSRAEGWLDDLVEALGENRRLLLEQVARHLPGVRVRAPEGTYLAWLDCRALGLEDPAAWFLERAHVALSPGADFGPGGEGRARLNFAAPPDLLEEAVAAMGRALESR